MCHGDGIAIDPFQQDEKGPPLPVRKGRDFNAHFSRPPVGFVWDAFLPHCLARRRHQTNQSLEFEEESRIRYMLQEMEPGLAGREAKKRRRPASEFENLEGFVDDHA